MPAKNSVKIYSANTVYHVYNRGVEKRIIFLDKQDYKVMLGYLKEYLSPPPAMEERIKKSFILQGRTFKGLERLPNNFFKKIELLAYCLMPNHFHFLIKQNDDKNSLREFMQSLISRYATYFNKRHERIGSLFQGKYKATMVENEGYIFHLSRYIHINPAEYTKDLINTYSSYAEYLGIRHTIWIKPDLILSYFNNQKLLPNYNGANSYKNFVEHYLKDNQNVVAGLTLE
jgi:putative transposase